MPADLLEVEITETALVADPSRVVPVLERLSALGIRVAIDDFGIGNTSISQLRDLPVDELKIDRLFVSDLGVGGREGSEVVVQAMVDLAHSFDLRVVAEGVEDEATAVDPAPARRRPGAGVPVLAGRARRTTCRWSVRCRARAGTRQPGAAASRSPRQRPAPTRHARPPRSPGPTTRSGEYRAFALKFGRADADETVSL